MLGHQPLDEGIFYEEFFKTADRAVRQSCKDNFRLFIILEEYRIWGGRAREVWLRGDDVLLGISFYERDLLEGAENAVDK